MYRFLRAIRLAPSVFVLGAVAVAPGLAQAAKAPYVASELHSAAPGIAAPRALNNDGLVAGLLTAPPASSQAALWNGKTWHTFGAGEADAINSHGETAGFTAGSTGARATEWDRQGHAHDLGTLGSGLWSQALAINDRGAVAGYAQFSGPTTHAFVWREGHGMHDLGTLGGGSSFAYAINRPGQVAGSSDGVGVLWDAQQRIHDLGAGPGSVAYDVSDNGVVVGAQGTHAFVWQAGKGLKTLETPKGVLSSVAVSIDSHGLIVGNATMLDSTGLPTQHAVGWLAGRMIDLNSLLGNASSQWELTSATAINDKGQIVGSGLLNDQPAAFVLNPA